MSVVFSGTVQGVFTSTGVNKIIQVPEGVDYIRVYNQTQIAAQSASTGYEFYYQYNMAAGTGIEYISNAGSTAVNTVWLTSGGFSPISNTVNTFGAAVNISAISNAAVPVVSTGSTVGLTNGSTIVRLYNTNSEAGGLQLGGVDFTVGTVVANTSFTLKYMAQVAAATGGQYRIVPFDPYFYPPTRVISAIASSTLNGANVAIVSMTVTHAYTVGQKIRFIVPTVTSTAFGMTALNGVEATILAIGAAGVNSTTNTITVDVDVSAMSAFAWPLSANGTFTPAQVVPVGENTAQALLSGVNSYQDAEINQGYRGILLGAGQNGPAGQNNDVIYWVAGKSFNGQ